ncbi:MAG TPA: alanine dehydrogenase [Candidatus Bathyarchaeia archaeon]|nr:alanine dehydrogenase [Candidatus Bathyarchaeia archaeon]
MKTLILAEDDVKRLLSMEEVMEAVELAFAEKGMNRAQTPSKVFLSYQKYNGDVRAMPSYLEGLDISAVEILNVHENNRAKFKLPTVMATVLMLEPKNGTPIAMIGGTYIANLRTGAAGGIAAKYLAKKSSKIVGLVGAGAQAKAQLMALLTLYGSLEEVRVWSRTKQTREEFLEHIKREVGKRITRVVPVERPEDAVWKADIIATTTPSRAPVVLNDWIQPGAHINCIGADAPGKQEIDSGILKRAKIVVDDWEQASLSGEINVPFSQGVLKKEDIWCSLGEIVAGLKQGRKSDDEITVFTSTGLAVQSAVTANIAYKKAMAHGLGQMIELL